MKFYFNIIVGCIAFVVPLAGYLTGNISSSLNNEVAMIVSPTQMLNVSLKDKGNQMTNDGDCYIPLPEKRKQISKGTMDLKTESGVPIKVSVTDYKPIEDFFFKRQPSTIEQARQRSMDLLQLDTISEFKANRKIFGYIIWVFNRESQNHSNLNNSNVNRHMLQGHHGAFRCYDFNGDGKFEYPNDDGSKPAIVPSWAANNYIRMVKDLKQ